LNLRLRLQYLLFLKFLVVRCYLQLHLRLILLCLEFLLQPQHRLRLRLL
jgi:hypothetical protein